MSSAISTYDGLDPDPPAPKTKATLEPPGAGGTKKLSRG